ncbi:MAG: hypothetical protein AAFZ15_34630 [Bacteroidota bacterium]
MGKKGKRPPTVLVLVQDIVFKHKVHQLVQIFFQLGVVVIIYSSQPFQHSKLNLKHIGSWLAFENVLGYQQKNVHGLPLLQAHIIVHLSQGTVFFQLQKSKVALLFFEKGILDWLHEKR